MVSPNADFSVVLGGASPDAPFRFSRRFFFSGFAERISHAPIFPFRLLGRTALQEPTIRFGRSLTLPLSAAQESSPPIGNLFFSLQFFRYLGGRISRCADFSFSSAARESSPPINLPSFSIQ
jgi:hypothetical protein